MLKADLHTHTVNSGDGLSTLLEMAKEASKRGVEILGITTHGPSTPGSYPEGAYCVFKRVPKVLFGVRILMSAELNIIDEKGTLDMDEENFKYLDYGLAGIHYGMEKENINKNTSAIVNAMKNPYIHIISHPISNFLVDSVKIAEAAVRYNKLLELNNSKFGYHFDLAPDMLERTKKMVEVIKKHKHMIIINSDAHIATDLAEDMAVMRYKKEINLSYDLIINNNLGKLRRFLKIVD
ncbi:MAG: PHP domain-containing protein [Nanoarchaeota archaeon]|nr:PHP domain-containing protein [Nanoarchaeota archaeon]